MAQIAYPLNNQDYGAADAQLYTCTRTAGVYSAESHLRVSALSGMTLNIAPGIAWLSPSTFQGFVFAVTADEQISVPAADSTFSRIDGVHIRYSSVAQSCELFYAVGTAAANPAAPAPIRDGNTYELVLARITVSANAMSIAAGNITDTRLTESLCGIMRDGVTAIPTAQLLTNAQNAINNQLEQNSSVIAGLAMRGATLATFSGTGWRTGNQTINNIGVYSTLIVEFGASGTARHTITANKVGSGFAGFFTSGTGIVGFGFQVSGNVCSPLSLNTVFDTTGMPSVGNNIVYVLDNIDTNPVIYQLSHGITRITGLI